MMRSVISAVSIALLIIPSGSAEILITADDHAVDSDVVLESAVEAVKAGPQDAADVVDDATTFIRDDAETAAAGLQSAVDIEISAHEKARKEGVQAVKDAWDTRNDIRFRSYKVSERLGDLLQAYTEDESTSLLDVADFFRSIEFPEGTAARYLPEFNSLLVHQTAENLLRIEDTLAGYRREQKKRFGRQVEIEAKFIEINEGTLNQLGFDWTFDRKDGGDLRVFDNFVMPAGQSILSDGLRSASTAFGGAPAAGALKVAKTAGSLQWSVVINALEQSDDSDVLSAPRVVTHSHEAAVIQVGEKRMIPKSFEVENQNTSPFVQHADWELELMGVYMEVRPEIRSDGLIDLELNTKILDIIGYDSYPIVPAYTRTTGDSVNKGGDEEDMLAINASLPYLRIRALETRATVADGSTIGMGGLIYDKLETYRDKVPVLGSIPWVGRVFRSEGERSVKRNLMIFVTATQVDMDGRRAVDLAREK
jgi:type II secretory pathway component GspD/PulD (secretin)